MPEGWAWIRQKNLGIALNGKAFKPSDWTKKGLPIVRIQNLNDKNASYNYYDKDIDETFLLHGGELLFAWSGTPGTSFGAHIWDKGEAVLNQHIFKILFDETIINKIFYKYCLNNQVEKLIEVAHGSAGLAHITKNMFDEVLIPLPPYNEQLRIVSEFEKTISLINCINDNKTELNDTIKQAKSKILDLAIHGKLVPQDPNDEPAEDLLKRIATSDNRPYEKVDEEVDYEIPKSWQFCKIKDVCSVIMGQSPEGEAVSDDKNGMEFHQGKICFGEKYLEESSSFTKHITKIAPKESVLLCVRAPVGIVNITEREICIGRGLCAVIPKYEINSDFWFYWLQSLQSDFEQKATGTTFRAISVDVIKNQIVAIPPHEEQNRIVNKINELYEQLDKIVLNLV